MVPDPRLRALHDARPRLFAFGNVAVGFIAIGNVAVGVVAIGASVAVGPIAIGINAVGILLGLGLNAIGTLVFAAINGVGLFSYAGVNGLGANASAYVNEGESVLVAFLLCGLQLVAAKQVHKRLPPTVKETPPATVPLAELASGAREEGVIRARIVSTTQQSVLIEEDIPDPVPTQLSLTGPSRASLAVAERLPGSPVLLVTVRATREAAPQSVEANYRSAPPTIRVLWADDFTIIAPPPPLWARPNVVPHLARASLFLSAAVSFAEGLRQLVLR